VTEPSCLTAASHQLSLAFSARRVTLAIGLAILRRSSGLRKSCAVVPRTPIHDSGSTTSMVSRHHILWMNTAQVTGGYAYPAHRVSRRRVPREMTLAPARGRWELPPRIRHE
jgi:hypothetical protein